VPGVLALRSRSFLYFTFMNRTQLREPIWIDLDPEPSLRGAKRRRNLFLKKNNEIATRSHSRTLAMTAYNKNSIRSKELIIGYLFQTPGTCEVPGVLASHSLRPGENITNPSMKIRVIRVRLSLCPLVSDEAHSNRWVEIPPCQFSVHHQEKTSRTDGELGPW